MKSIDKLREFLKKCESKAGIEPNRFDTYWITAKACDTLIDEIEAEIADNYMLLPVDADGVPIHVGDEMFGDCPSGKHVSGRVAFIGENRFMLGNVQFYLRGDYMHHVKPRTLEDVLREYGHAYYAHMTDNYMNYDGTDEQVVKKYADEIRELLKADVRDFEIDEPDTIRNELLGGDAE